MKDLNEGVVHGVTEYRPAERNFSRGESSPMRHGTFYSLFYGREIQRVVMLLQKIYAEHHERSMRGETTNSSAFVCRGPLSSFATPCLVPRTFDLWFYASSRVAIGIRWRTRPGITEHSEVSEGAHGVGEGLSKHLKQARLAARAARRSHLMYGGALTIFASAALFDSLGAHFLLFLASAAMVVVTHAVAQRPMSRYEDEASDAIVTAACEHVGNTRYQRFGITKFPLGQFRELRLVGNYRCAWLEHLIEGRHRGCNFAFVDAKLAKNSSARESNLF